MREKREFKSNIIPCFSKTVKTVGISLFVQKFHQPLSFKIFIIEPLFSVGVLRTRVLCSAFFCVVRREISKFKHIIVSFESFCAQIRARKDRKIQRVEFQDQTSKTPLFCTKHLENYENKVI